MEVVVGPLMSGPDVPVGNSPGYGSSFATQEFRQFSHKALPWREWADLDEHMDTFCYQYYSASSGVVSEAQQEMRKLIIFKHNGASGAWCNLGHEMKCGEAHEMWRGASWATSDFPSRLNSVRNEDQSCNLQSDEELEYWSYLAYNRLVRSYKVRVRRGIPSRSYVCTDVDKLYDLFDVLYERGAFYEYEVPWRSLSSLVLTLALAGAKAMEALCRVCEECLAWRGDGAGAEESTGDGAAAGAG